ncbi:discoidin domain-containing protein [Nocardioides mesophilus]|uniref:Discoidin domain-containing protein n=1 Tax=Nocardioides mesophilus TaxID=433659 RepID=A0A7G9REA8_9ACTN|nr:discoidin domain-containing protein [Nocardioides mesophilus]QNN53933.1 discoidin domain-containing protein [Nocardioides mesophilus]
MLQVIERFVDRAEDFWQESAGTFDANGAGVTQPRGKGNIAIAYATLLTARPDQQFFGEERHPRSELLDHVDRTIFDAAMTNKSQGGNWGGGTWQAALETSGWGTAAYMLRDQLSDRTLDVAGKVIRYEADILINKKAATATPGNTGGEDNGWNTPLPELAAGWWPTNPHAPAWRRTAQRLAVNASTVPSDVSNTEDVVDGRTVADWTESSNLLPDLTLENHGFFNPLYQQVIGYDMGEAILTSRLTGQPVPEAFEFRVEKIYDKILAPLITPDGDLLMTHGQDWVAKDYQHLGYLALMGTWFQRPDATEYASRALAAVKARQDARSDGAIIGQADVGYESVLIKRMSYAYLMRQNLGPAAVTDAAGMSKIEGSREGVHTYEASKFALDRQDGTLRSINWTSARPMGLLIPDGTLHPADPVLVNYAIGSLIGAPASSVTAASCECDEDKYAVAQIVGGRGFAVGSLPNGLMPVLEAGKGRTFPVTLERIAGLTGDRPISGPDGPLPAGVSDVPWFNIDSRLGMVVSGGAGIDVQRGIRSGENFLDSISGSVAGGDGRRAAVLAPDLTDADMAALAASTSRPATPNGWQAVQATAPDGSVGVLAARFAGPVETDLELAGGPVIPSGVVVDGSVSTWHLSASAVEARAQVAPAKASSTAPVIASAPRADVVKLSNEGDQVAEVTVTFAGGQVAQGSIAPGERAVAVVSGTQAFFGSPALVDLVDALGVDPKVDNHVWQAITALAAGDESESLDQIMVALRDATSPTTAPLSRAAAGLVGISLHVPEDVSLVRGETPTMVPVRLTRQLGERTAAPAKLTVTSDLAAGPVTATTDTFKAGDELVASVELHADPTSEDGTVVARASVKIGPGTLTLSDSTRVSVLDPLVVAVSPRQVSLGGSIERSVRATVQNRLSRPVVADVTFDIPEGVDATSKGAVVSVPAHGETELSTDLVRAGVTDGLHRMEVRVTATEETLPDGVATVDFFASPQMALNRFGTGFPRMTASSTQTEDYLPANANDGDGSTFWVSNGWVAGDGPTAADPELLTLELGATVQVGSVTVQPRLGFGPKTMDIEGRVEGEWVTLARDVSQANATEEHAVPLSQVDALRLRITSAYDRISPSRSVQVAEVSISDQVPPTNVAVGAVATASSSQALYPATNAVDGIAATFWVSGAPATPTSPQWVIVDLGRTVELSQLRMVPRINSTNDYGPSEFAWQVDDGAGGWTTLGNRSRPRLATSDSLDVSATARYVRLSVTAGWDPRGVQVAELEVLGR